MENKLNYIITAYRKKVKFTRYQSCKNRDIAEFLKLCKRFKITFITLNSGEGDNFINVKDYVHVDHIKTVYEFITFRNKVRKELRLLKRKVPKPVIKRGVEDDR